MTSYLILHSLMCVLWVVCGSKSKLRFLDYIIVIITLIFQNWTFHFVNYHVQNSKGFFFNKIFGTYKISSPLLKLQLPSARWSDTKLTITVSSSSYSSFAFLALCFWRNQSFIELLAFALLSNTTLSFALKWLLLFFFITYFISLSFPKKTCLSFYLSTLMVTLFLYILSWSYQSH